MTGTSTPSTIHCCCLSFSRHSQYIRATQGTGGGGVCHVIIIWLAHQHQVLMSFFLQTLSMYQSYPRDRRCWSLSCHADIIISFRYSQPLDSAHHTLHCWFLHLSCFWSIPFLSDRNPLWTHSNPIYKKKSLNCRPSMFSGPCWCLHQFQVSWASFPACFELCIF